MSGVPENTFSVVAPPERRARLMLFGLTSLAAMALLWQFSGKSTVSQGPVSATAVCSGPGAEVVAKRMIKLIRDETTLHEVLERIYGRPLDLRHAAEFRAHLVVQDGSAGLARRRVTVEYAGSAAEAAMVVNNLVQQGVTQVDASADPAADEAIVQARTALETATQQANTAQQELDEFLAENYADLHTEPIAATPTKKTITKLVPNPAWQTLDKELEFLRGYREDLANKMTPEHPRVRELDLKVALTTDRLTGTPRLIEQEIEVENPVDHAALAAQQAARETLQAEYKRLDTQHQQRQQELSTRLETLEQLQEQQTDATCDTWVSTWADPPRSQHLRLGVFGLLAVLCGGGAAAKGVRPNPALANLPDVSTALGIPILGVVRSNTQVPVRKARLTGVGRLLVGLSVVVLGGTLLAVLLV